MKEVFLKEKDYIKCNFFFKRIIHYKLDEFTVRIIFFHYENIKHNTIKLVEKYKI